MTVRHPLILAACVGGTLLCSQLVHAQSSLSYRHSTRLTPTDYYFGAKPDPNGDIFDQTNQIDLSAHVGVGADCGKVNLQTTLHSTLQNLLDARYFGNLGQDILASSPMLATCYFSPTWCSILKHLQINANLLSQSRLKQCSLIDKYIDDRTEDYYRERQTCVQKQIASNGGNIEAALAQCQDTFQATLTNWSGPSFGNTTTNQLIESSAQWAGLVTPSARRALNLAKALVGDTRVSNGSISVDFGPDGIAKSPRTYLMEVQKRYERNLCADVLGQVEEGRPIEQTATQAQIAALVDDQGQPLLDNQTLEALAYMAPSQRAVACRKLARSLATTTASRDLNESVDVLQTLSENPNLPPHRRKELQEKLRSLRESTALTLALQREKDEPLNELLAHINAEGLRNQQAATAQRFSSDRANQDERSHRSIFFDCADGVMCR